MGNLLGSDQERRWLVHKDLSIDYNVGSFKNDTVFVITHSIKNQYF